MESHLSNNIVPVSTPCVFRVRDMVSVDVDRPLHLAVGGGRIHRPSHGSDGVYVETRDTGMVVLVRNVEEVKEDQSWVTASQRLS